MSFNLKEVKIAAEGRWYDICSALAPHLGPAMERIGRHVPCPVHGGEDGFRLFKDFEKTGGGICNTCGAKTDGFALLSWITGWDLNTTVNAVGAYLGMTASRIPSPIRMDKGKRVFRKYARLVEVGNAPYRFDRNAQDSPFIRIRTPKQDEFDSTVLWGKDLLRAVRSSGARSGDWIEVMRLGTQEVKTPSGLRHRAVWSVVKREAPEQAEKSRNEAAVSAAKENRRKADRIVEAWSEAAPLREGDKSEASVVAYLRRRMIFPPKSVLESDVLRAGPETPLYTNDTFEGRFRTLCAAVRDSKGRLVTLHRTFLSPSGFKAEVDHPKRIMALPSDRTILGASVQFGEPQKVLAVAEGIETALSVVQGLRIPCWAALSAVGLEHFEPPAQVSVLLIMADKDRSGAGAQAAEKLKARMEENGLAAFIFMPEDEIPEGAKGIDWNDVLRERGPQGFPRPF